MVKSTFIGDENDDDEVAGSNMPWYMISKDHRAMVAWNLIFSVVIMYNMITVPLMLCFPWINENVSKS